MGQNTAPLLTRINQDLKHNKTRMHCSVHCSLRRDKEHISTWWETKCDWVRINGHVSFFQISDNEQECWHYFCIIIFLQSYCQSKLKTSPLNKVPWNLNRRFFKMSPETWLIICNVNATKYSINIFIYIYIYIFIGLFNTFF